MHYFTHGVNIAAVENVTQAAKYEQAGWRPVSRSAFIAAWRARDRQALSELPISVEGAQNVGGVIERLPNGWAWIAVAKFGAPHLSLLEAASGLFLLRFLQASVAMIGPGPKEEQKL